MTIPTLVRCAIAVASLPFLASAQLYVDFGFVPATITFTSQADQPVAAPQNLIILTGTVPFVWDGAFFGINFVTLSPASGVGNTTLKVALNPNIVPYLAPGQYSLSLSFESPDPTQPGDGAVTVTLYVLPPDAPVITGVVNSASQQPVLSEGELVSIYGSNLGTGPLAPAGSYSVLQGNATATFSRQPLSFEPLSNAYGGHGGTATGNATTVTFNQLPAPLLYVSPNQINAVVPYFAQPGDASGNVPVVVTHDGQASPPFLVPIAATSPGLFTVAPNGRGQGAIQNVDPQTGAVTPNSPSNPAAKGSTIVLWGTGNGGFSQIPPDGVIITDVLTPPYYVVTRAISLTIGGQPAKILYAGAAPNQVFGLLQVNAVVPSGIGSGPQPVVLTITGSDNSQQAVTVAVQ
jgi:uncharacterized protein (TIGR03437 family)